MLPDEVLPPYEWRAKGKPYREFLIPAVIVNDRAIELRLSDYDEEFTDLTEGGSPWTDDDD